MAFFPRLRRAPSLQYLNQRNYSHLRPLASSQISANDLKFQKLQLMTTRQLSMDSFLKQDSVTQYVLDSIVDSKLSWWLAEKLLWVHDGLGVPWWTVIIMASMSRFIFVLPTQAYSQKVIARRKMAYTEMEEKIPKLKNKVNNIGKQNQWSFTKTRARFHVEQAKLKRSLIIKHNCANMKIFAPLYLQMPIFLSFNAALRKISNGDELMMTEGPPLMTNLTLPVETWILPIFVGSIYWLSLQVNASQVHNISAVTMSSGVLSRQKFMRYFIHSLILVMVFLCGQVESGLALFWAGSATSALASNLLLISPRVLSLLRIPRFPGDPKHPYRTFADYLATKLKLK